MNSQAMYVAILRPLTRSAGFIPHQTAGRSFATEATSQLKMRLRDPKLFREQGYIGGKWTDAQTAKTFSIFNPHNGDMIGKCPEMDHTDTSTAIEVAQRAFDRFRLSTPRQRMDILKRWFRLMQEHEEDLATILSFENGRPLQAARAEIKYAASFFEWFQGEAVRSYGDTIQSSTPGNRVLTLRQPIGVVGIITPWNFPSAMITRKVGASVAAGCSVVLKPAAETPYSALALAELGERAGLPGGVFNVVTTDRNVVSVGKTICEDPIVKKLSFTGSTGVGKILMKQSSSTLKKLSMELGGNAPFIVFDDADIEKAIEGLMAAKFRASGQTCVCANRVYVQEGIHDRFIDRYSKAVRENMIAGDPLEKDTTLGPLINLKAREKVERLIQDACENGAEVVLGGARSSQDVRTFYPATILKNMKPTMQASREEWFGPVVAFYKFGTEEELLNMANDSEVGLAAYVYTDKMSQAWRAAELLQTGMVGINTGMISDPVAPFGGIKQSGFGREGGRVGVEEFQIVKTITLGELGLPDGKNQS